MVLDFGADFVVAGVLSTEVSSEENESSLGGKYKRPPEVAGVLFSGGVRVVSAFVKGMLSTIYLGQA